MVRLELIWTSLVCGAARSGWYVVQAHVKRQVLAEFGALGSW